MIKKKQIATILSLALISTMILSAIQNQNIPTVNAQDDYGNVLQYEWPQSTGESPSNTHFSSGPAPSTPNILWKFTETGGSCTAFGGFVFARKGGASGRPGAPPGPPPKVFALDPFTGEAVYTLDGASGTVYKFTDTLMIIGRSCYETATGTLVWTSPISFSMRPYVPELKMSFGGTTAWEFSDGGNGPPTVAWQRTDLQDVDTRTVYGDGRLYGSGLGHEIALNATTGETIWDVDIQGTTDYNGCYYMGRWLKTSLDGRVYAFDGDTGEIDWIFDPGTFWNYWCTAPAAGYGMFYMYNLDRHVYAIDVETGELAWAYETPGHIYAGFPVVADEKLYTTMGYNGYRDPDTGAPGRDEYSCVNALTGEEIWTLPFAAGQGYSDAHCIAYGNLYVSEVGSTEIWCISDTPKDWPMFRGDAAHTADGTGPQDLQLKWKFQTGSVVISSPTIVDGVVYAGSHDKNIYALNADTGSEIWNFTTNYRIKSSPAVVNGKLYTGTDDGNVYCLDAQTGAKLWQNTVPGDIELTSGQSAQMDIRSSPTVVDGKVYVGSIDKNFYCINANSGSTLWTFTTTGPITSSAAVVDDAVYITSSTPRPKGTLYKLNATTGSLIWEKGMFYARGPDMHASPTVADGVIYLPADARDYYAINATDGATIWKISGDQNFAFTYLSGSVLHVNGKLYMADPNQFLFSCYNAADGEKIWTKFLGREVYSSPTYSLGKIYVGTENFALYVLDAKTGEQLSYYDAFESNKIWSSPTPYNNRLYIGSFEGTINCLEEKSNPPPIIAAQIDLSLSENTVVKGESLYIEGSVTNVKASIPLTVSVDYPDSTYDDIELLTDVNGYFQVIYTPRMVGDLTVFAWCEGGDFYYGGACDPLTLTVVDPQPTPPPDPTPPPMTDTYIIGFGAAAIIAIVIFGVLILMKVRKK